MTIDVDAFDEHILVRLIYFQSGTASVDLSNRYIFIARVILICGTELSIMNCARSRRTRIILTTGAPTAQPLSGHNHRLLLHDLPVGVLVALKVRVLIELRVNYFI